MKILISLLGDTWLCVDTSFNAAHATARASERKWSYAGAVVGVIAQARVAEFDPHIPSTE